MHIDWWTLALQAVNVLILVWILGRFFYRPIANIIEARNKAAAGIMADASALRAATEAEKVQLQLARTGLSGERDRLLSEARTQIESERSAMLQDASGRIDRLRSESEAMLARDRATMEHALVRQASALAVQIARKLLERVSTDSPDAVFLGAFFEQINSLPPRSRDELAASAREMRVTTGSPLSEAQQQDIQARMDAVLNSKTRMAFCSEPRLIAGVELSAGAFVFKNSWENDLSQILEQLRSDDGQQQVS